MKYYLLFIDFEAQEKLKIEKKVNKTFATLFYNESKISSKYLFSSTLNRNTN